MSRASDSELLAALRKFDGEFCKDERRGRPRASLQGVRESYFRAGAEWMQQQIDKDQPAAAESQGEGETR